MSGVEDRRSKEQADAKGSPVRDCSRARCSSYSPSGVDRETKIICPVTSLTSAETTQARSAYSSSRRRPMIIF